MEGLGGVEGAAYGEYAGHGAQQEEGVVVGLGHVRHPHTLDHQLHVELVLLQNVCTRTGLIKKIKRGMYIHETHS